MNYVFNMELLQALNPLYAFPIVAVILCAFVVYAFGFKSPVQPPSFEGIEEEKKVSKKRKSKESNKVKAVQNGKINGSSVNKPHISPPEKKKETEKFILMDKQMMEKSSTNEKRATKKAKSQNEKKNILEKKKEILANEDTAEDGWVQLISKKERKSRKKDEACSTDNHSVNVKPVKISEISKSDDSSPSEEFIERNEMPLQNSVPEKPKPVLKEEKSRKKEVSNELSKHALKSKKKEVKEKRNVFEVTSKIEISSEKIEEDTKSNISNSENITSKENVKSGKLVDESSNKSKKKKKKNAEVINSNNESFVSISELPPIQVNSELATDKNAAIKSAVTIETFQVVSGKIERNQPKETKSSNVAFDELAGIYPEVKEQRKKKKVRRDH